MGEEQLLRDYWNAQAQFGPFEVGPDEFVRRCQADIDDGEEDTLP